MFIVSGVTIIFGVSDVFIVSGVTPLFGVSDVFIVSDVTIQFVVSDVLKDEVSLCYSASRRKSTVTYI